MKEGEAGYTLVELLVSIAVLAILSLAAFELFTSLLHSAIVAQRQAVASTLATNQMEYLKSLSYNNLAVSGGPIIAPVYIPGTTTKKVKNTTYTVKTKVTYADDAYDGCGSYPTQALKQQYCRNYPAPAGAPATDGNPGDYRDVNVVVTDPSNTQLASLDTQISALVAETASNTGALFVRVIDDSGNPITGAQVQATNSSVSPAVNVTDTTDNNGIVIFYDLPPSTANYRYQIAASMDGYSSLTTIAPSGTLQPTYSSQNLIAQSSSFVTLTLKPQGKNSLIVEATDVNGAALSNLKVFVKGGYKQYTATSDSTYYYSTPATPTDKRPLTDGTGQFALTDLVPGNYLFCDDAGISRCTGTGGTYYVAAAVPYGGDNSLQPIIVPTSSADNPPATTFPYNGVDYLQKVRLILTTNPGFPRVTNLSPYDVSLTTSNLSGFAFTLTGTNLPCSNNPASCTTKVSFVQGSNTFVASCKGTSGTVVNCTVNLNGAVAGTTQMIVKVNTNTLTVPGSPLQGGIRVTP